MKPYQGKSVVQFNSEQNLDHHTILVSQICPRYRRLKCQDHAIDGKRTAEEWIGNPLKCQCHTWPSPVPIYRRNLDIHGMLTDRPVWTFSTGPFPRFSSPFMLLFQGSQVPRSHSNGFYALKAGDRPCRELVTCRAIKIKAYRSGG